MAKRYVKKNTIRKGRAAAAKKKNKKKAVKNSPKKKSTNAKRKRAMTKKKRRLSPDIENGETPMLDQAGITEDVEQGEVELESDFDPDGTDGASINEPIEEGEGEETVDETEDTEGYF